MTMTIKLSRTPTALDIRQARLAIKLGLEIGRKLEDFPEVTRAVAEWPLEDAAPEPERRPA